MPPFVQSVPAAEHAVADWISNVEVLDLDQGNHRLSPAVQAISDAALAEAAAQQSAL